MVMGVARFQKIFLGMALATGLAVLSVPHVAQAATSASKVAKTKKATTVQKATKRKTVVVKKSQARVAKAPVRKTVKAAAARNTRVKVQMAGGKTTSLHKVSVKQKPAVRSNVVRASVVQRPSMGEALGLRGNDDALDPLLVQVPRHQADGLAGTDQQRLAAVQVAEDLLGQAHRGKRHRHRVLADRGIGAHGLGGAEGGLKQAPEQRANGAGLARHGIGGLHLPENLRLAQHHRVQPRGHPHHVAHRGIVLEHVGTGAQLVEAEPVVLGQPDQHPVDGQHVLFEVQLAAVTGRQNRRLAAGRAPAELLQGLDQLLRGKSHAFANRHRSGFMVDPEGNKGHAQSLAGR